MLRHACDYKLANDGHDTRSLQAYLGRYKLANDGHDSRCLQAYLGHRNIQNTARGIRRWRRIGSRASGETDLKPERDRSTLQSNVIRY